MNTKRLRTGVAAAMGGAVLVTGLLVGSSLALADDTDQADTTTQEESRAERDGFMKDRFHRMAGGLADLADELGLSLEDVREQLQDGKTLEEIAAGVGIDIDEVFTSLRESALAEVDEHLAAGDITQEQADAIKERIESFEPGERPFGPRPHRGMVDVRGFLGDLDIDLDGLGDLIASGMTMEEALESLGVDVEAMLSDIIETATAHIDELVNEGRITQEQADEMRERLEDFELGGGFPMGRRGFDSEGFRSPRGHGFFGGGPGDGNAEEALLNI